MLKYPFYQQENKTQLSRPYKIPKSFYKASQERSHNIPKM